MFVVVVVLKLTVKVERDGGVGLAVRVLSVHLVLAAVAHGHVVDLEAREVGVVGQLVAVGEIAARVGYLDLVAVPDELRLRFGAQLALEAQALAVGIRLDLWLLCEARRKAAAVSTQ